MSRFPKQYTKDKESVNGKGQFAIHVDLDGAKHVYQANGLEYNSQDDYLFETGLRNALQMFSGMQVRATLFVIGEDLKNSRKTEILKEAVLQGHEIASHSLTHQKFSTLTREQKRREIFESREIISAKLGVTVEGFRAPGFDINREALELIDEAGYRYDSSVFPSAKFAKRLGVTSIEQSPHYPLTGRSLLELPLPGHLPLPVPFHFCYSLVLGTWYFRLGLNRFQQTGAPLILLFHLTDLAEPLPNRLLAGLRAKFFTLSFASSLDKRRQCEEMLELVEQKYHLVDTISILRGST